MEYVIVGGGITGLIAAWKLKANKPGASVTLIEAKEDLGGLLSGISYPREGLYFDKGTHIYQETGDEKLDSFLNSVVQQKSFIRYPLGFGDLSGAIFNGRLQENSHFPDLRGWANSKDIAKLIKDKIISLTGTAGVGDISREKKLETEMVSRFGSTYTKEILTPILGNLYQQNTDNLAAFSMLLPGLTRVIIDDYKSWFDKADSKVYRDLIAIPDQQKLPPKFRHSRHSFYTKSGSRGLVDAIESWLEKFGVHIYKGATVTDIDKSGCSISFVDQGGEAHNKVVSNLILTMGVVGAARLLGIDIKDFGFSTPMPHRIVNIQLKEQCESELFYLYGLDVDCDFYRVTNYAAFSGSESDRRLTIEVLGDRGIADDELPQHLIDQLYKVGFLESRELVFSNVHKLPYGFPVPTVSNMSSLIALSSYLSNTLPENVMVGGSGVGGGLFFQNELLLDICEKMEAVL